MGPAECNGEGNGVYPLLCECATADILNTDGLLCVFPPLYRWPTVVACPRLTRCVCLCFCVTETALQEAINVVEQAERCWIISAAGQVEGRMA